MCIRDRYFADQDAFIFNFKGSVAGQTKISSTSRATLELYNPYYDSDEDELTVDPENVVIYAVADDGSLNDVTASFKAIENEDGDYVAQTKTRELGVYIIAEKPYTTAAAEDVETLSLIHIFAPAARRLAGCCRLVR